MTSAAPAAKGQGKQNPNPKSARRVLVSQVSRGLGYSLCLEIFCGTARLARSLRRYGYGVLVWDIGLGPQYDLRDPKKRQLIVGWIRCGLISAVHLGTPCGSFSRIRDRPNGPPRLRSDQCPRGLPGLAPNAQEEVRLGNLFANFSALVLLTCSRSGVPGTLENPSSSRLWLMPSVISILGRRASSSVVFDMCSFGTQWRKPTRLLGVCVDLIPRERRCTYTNHICSTSGGKHLVLEGRAPSGKYWTSLAAAYPWKFANALAKVLADGVVARKLARLSRTM
jgi:hypothetical protein